MPLNDDKFLRNSFIHLNGRVAKMEGKIADTHCFTPQMATTARPKTAARNSVRLKTAHTADGVQALTSSAAAFPGTLAGN